MHKTKGFTLIEILMVILLVSIISAVLLPQFINYTKDAKTAVTQEKLNDLKIAIIGDARQVAQGQPTKIGFLKNIGAAPASLNDLVNQGAYPAYNPLTKLGWNGPYVNATDPSWSSDAW